MKTINIWTTVVFLFLLTVFLPANPQVFAAESVWQEAGWQGPSKGTIRKIRFAQPQESSDEESLFMAAGSPATDSVGVNVIDSPPIDGFVPWIVIMTTDERLADTVWDAVPEASIFGTLTPNDPEQDYAIGIFDTGASASVMGYSNSLNLGLQKAQFLTDNPTTITGVTGSVEALVSYPLGLFIGGLDQLEPNQPGDPYPSKLADLSGLKGESNVSILIGQEPIPPAPDLATAIGSPMSVFYTTLIQTDQSVTIEHNNEVFTAPTITLFDDQEDPQIPDYPIDIPLELRPLGSTWVQYVPFDIEDIFNLDFTPSSPSVIVGTGSQSLFFVHSVDLYDGPYSAIDKTRFMLDTGAQVSTISSRVAARLGINHNTWDFQVEIEGVDGNSITANGYYLDALKIPALGQWLEYTNVPVILIDIASPEGGTLDGIIGMNLFTEYNMVLRGGGLFLQEDPMLEVQRFTANIPADLAPVIRDGRVNMTDWVAFSSAWLSQYGQDNWNPDADMAPEPPDGTIDLEDLAVFVLHWMSGITHGF